MKDYGISVLDQYPLEIFETHRIRSGILCETDQGLFLLKQCEISEKRLPVLIELYKCLEQQKGMLIDMPIANKEGLCLTKAEDETTYMLKRWFEGKECDVRKEEELVEGAATLARLHRAFHSPASKRSPKDMRKEYDRHNRELRKIRDYARKVSLKGEFERVFLQGFDAMYIWADAAQKRLDAIGYEELLKKAEQEEQIAHGEYNYHNLICTEQGMAVTNFEHARAELQINDLYYYLRKILEKHRYSERIGSRILSAYEKEKPLTKQEKDYLAIRLAYPEKYWKTANFYYQTNKAWISARNVEKMQVSLSQQGEKKKFLQNIFAFHL